VNNLKRKWKLIQEECKRLGYRKAAEKAGRIDQLLNELYETKHTTNWREDYKEITKSKKGRGSLYDSEYFDIFTLAYSGKYCVACIQELGCSKCLFREHAGKCGKKSSLFNQFISTYLSECR